MIPSNRLESKTFFGISAEITVAYRAEIVGNYWSEILP